MIVKNKLIQDYDDGRERPLLGEIDLSHVHQTGYSSMYDAGLIAPVSILEPSRDGPYLYGWDYPEWRKLGLLSDYSQFLFIDIECDMPENVIVGDEVSLARFPVTCITLLDMLTGEYEQLTDEDRILDVMEGLFTSDVVILAWNADFDVRYLLNRIRVVRHRRLNVRAQCVDYLSLYRHWYRANERSFRLEHILTIHGLGGKVKYDGTLWELYRNNRELYYEYNRQDVLRVYEMDKRIRLFDLCREIIRMTNSTWQDILSNTRLLENMIYKYLERRGLVMSNRRETQERPYSGAYVYNPMPGVYYKDSSCYDVAALYPHIMINWNISPETLTPDESVQSIQCITGRRYRTDTTGVIPALLRELLIRRTQYKREGNSVAEQACKRLANSFYGAMGTPHFRFYNPDIAEDITCQGRHISLTVANIIENGEIDAPRHYMLPLTTLESRMEQKRKYVLAGDTDSLFIRGKVDHTEFINHHLAEYMKAWGCVGGPDFMLRVKNEYGLIDALWLRPVKKHYWLKAGDKIVSKGGLVRTSTPEYSNEIMNDIVNIILNGGTVDEARHVINEAKRLFIEHPYLSGWWRPYKIVSGKEYKVETRAIKACRNTGITSSRGFILEMLRPPEGQERTWKSVPFAADESDDIKLMIDGLLTRGYKINVSEVYESVMGEITRILEELSDICE